jgi:agmatine/peptidylarginine deiminase
MSDEDVQTIEGPNSTWVEIATTPTEEEARLLQGFLEAEGIPCQVESLRFDQAPVNFGKLGEIRIYVSAENEEAAQQLLASRDAQYENLPTDESVVTDEGPATITDDAQTLNENEE